MQTTFSHPLLHSRIARRILGLFVLCALLPTSILGWVSYRQVTEQLIVQTSARLKQESKSQGMVLYSHLLTLTADLDRIATGLPQTGIVREDTTITASVKELGQRFQEIRLLAASDPSRRPSRRHRSPTFKKGRPCWRFRLFPIAILASLSLAS